MKILIIVPAFNEEVNILNVVQNIVDMGYDYIVINDGSHDATERVCQKHHINLVSLSENLGIGGAVQTGHMYALEHGYDVDIQVDGDGQHDISYIPKLLQAIKSGNDLAIGSRFIRPNDGFHSTGMRRLGIRWLQRCIHVVTGLNITDATSGFRASGSRAINLFAKDYPIDYPEPESIVTAYNAGLSISEVPVKMRERQGGISSINVKKSMYYMIKVTLAIFIEGIGKKQERAE
jgi:glycosyltransferase involved in cell wall biosynthesis